MHPIKITHHENLALPSRTMTVLPLHMAMEDTSVKLALRAGIRESEGYWLR
jgi:hypothetical protein